MKKFALIATLSTLLFSITLSAENTSPSPTTALTADESATTPLAEEPAATPTPTPAPDNTGVAAATARDTAKTSSLQNWIFAGGAVTAAIIGIVIVALSQGGSSH